MTRVRFILLPLSAVCFFLAACSNSGEESSNSDEAAGAASQKAITLRLVSNAQTKRLASEIVNGFAASGAKLATGEAIAIKNEPYDQAKSLIEDLSSGRMKSHLWLSGSRSEVSWVNQNLKNLAAEQGDCIPVFENSLSLVSSQEMDVELREDGSISFADALRSPTKNPNAGKRILLTRPPADLQSGFATLRKLQHSLTEAPTLNEAFGAHTPIIAKDLKAANKVLRNLPEGSFVTTFIDKADGKALPGNFKQVPIAEGGSIWSLCLSKSDWIKANERAAISAFVEYVKKSHLITPSELALPEDATDFGPQEAKNLWREVKPPVAIAMIADTSGSMGDENKLDLQRWIFEELQSKLTIDDRNTLISFESDARVHLPLLPARPYGNREISGRLKSFRAIGGSAVYDAVRLGLEQLLYAPDGYRKLLVLVCDGLDTHSQIKAARIKDLIERRFRDSGIITLAIGLRTVDSNFGELRTVFKDRKDFLLEVQPAKALDAIRFIEAFL